ncbi:uncharacterized protein PRCAT00000687001 [Priceomyces carsonii]|uniref:uncharacterized protein n=1 Tax=Priceomyces carsonii TaxID=28549 RepID=UPI002ED82CFA|nr:unnamed protein product [Priceomyces carsonii]
MSKIAKAVIKQFTKRKQLKQTKTVLRATAKSFKKISEKNRFSPSVREDTKTKKLTTNISPDRVLECIHVEHLGYQTKRFCLQTIKLENKKGLRKTQATLLKVASISAKIIAKLLRLTGIKTPIIKLGATSDRKKKRKEKKEHCLKTKGREHFRFAISYISSFQELLINYFTVLYVTITCTRA